MRITLSAGDDPYYVFDGFLGGTSEAALGNVRNDTIDGAAGRDQLNLDYAYPDRNFNLAVDATTGVVTLTTATGSINFERFEVVAFNNVSFLIGGEAGDALVGSPGNDPGLYGLGGDDTLDGGGGRDTLFGGAGNDTYVVDNSGDAVQESTTLNGSVDAGGIDIVRAAINFALGNFVENLELTGSAVSGTGNALANAITGNGAANSLSGAAGDDTLDGGAGADTLSGGAGNDTYRLDDARDVVQEDGQSDPGGSDTVLSAVSHTLGERFENLELLGTAALNGTGNGAANRLSGNAAANSLSGGAGQDSLAGGAGNDTLEGGADSDRLSGGAGNDLYRVDAAGDLALEEGSTDPGGIDTVEAAVSYTLDERLENLLLTGAGASSGTGNALANRLIGNDADNTLEGGAGNDTLEGRGGADSLRGGAGNDTYVVNGAGDRVDEATATGSGVDAGGKDVVRSSVSFTLGSFLETLVLTGSGAVQGGGNGAANTLTGNGGANLLSGLGGADVLDGGAGKDTLAGGAGKDFFVFSSALNADTNVDLIRDWGTGGTSDVIRLDDDVFTALGPTGALPASAFTNGKAASSADHRIVYDRPTGELYYDADGTGPAEQIHFATVGASTHPALTAAAFVIVG